MSVMIMGFKLPTACSKCDCGNGDYGFCQITRDSWWHIDPSTERMDNCPIVPIPDHGDLIDRDALNDKAEFIGDAFSGRGGFVVWCDDVINAPVVIPAERSEDGYVDMFRLCNKVAPDIAERRNE